MCWSAHFEGTGAAGTPFDITTGSIPGCTKHSTKTLTYYNGAVNSTDQASDGTYSIYRPGTGSDYATSPLSGMSLSAASIKFDIYFVSGVAGTIVFQVRYDASNRFYATITTNDLIFYWSGSGTTKSVSTSDWNFSSGAWHTIRAQARVGTSPYLRATLDGGSVKTYTAADNVAMNNAANLLYLGYNLGSGDVYYLDKVQVWNDWQTGTEWGD